jgi:hypothetical protein
MHKVKMVERLGKMQCPSLSKRYTYKVQKVSGDLLSVFALGELA